MKELLPTEPLKIAGSGFIPEYVDNDKEAQANANLISAAPELYDALSETALQIEYLHDKFSETGTGNAVLVRARIALAKAHGEQP